MVSFGIALHRALDFFFCDRCITEAKLPGRPIELPDPIVVQIVNLLCPIQYLFRLLPDEEETPQRRIYFPRSWLSQSQYDEKEGIRE